MLKLKTNIYQVLFFVLAVIFISSCQRQSNGFIVLPTDTIEKSGLLTDDPSPKEDLKESEQCITSAKDFAYYVVERSDSDSTEKVLPSSPWHQAKFNPPLPADVIKNMRQVDIQRSVNGNQEIWISIKGDYTPWEFLVYKPEDSTWKLIPRQVEDNIYIDELFVTTDGSVWGSVYWTDWLDNTIEGLSLLAKYNETKERFEYTIPNGMNTLIASYDVSYPPKFVLDNLDNFWTVWPGDAIYRFNTETETMKRFFELPAIDQHQHLYGLTVGPDNSIYFGVSTYEDVKVFKYSYIQNSLLPLESPLGTFPRFGNLSVDKKGRLWFGSMAYLRTDGTESILHPFADEFIEKNHNSHLTLLPLVLHHSSDGRVWLGKYHPTEPSYAEGVAWLDPETGDGCQFTNVGVKNIVEDENQTLWFIGDGKLFYYSMR
jgi:hypothetical protein